MRPLQFILVAIARIGIGDAFVVLRLQLQIQEFTLFCDKLVDGGVVQVVTHYYLCSSYVFILSYLILSYLTTIVYSTLIYVDDYNISI